MTRLRWTIAAAAISLEWLVGPQLHPALLALSLALLLTIGIGHGGLDLWLAHRADLRVPRALLVLVYLGGMAAMGLVWLVSPTAAFVLFVGLSAYHFGEVRGHGPLLALTHGLFVIGAAASARPDIANDVLRAMALEPPEHLFAPWVFLLLHLVALAFIAGRRGPTRAFQGDALDSVLLFFLLATVHPVIGFILYFTLWHATDHIVDIYNAWARQTSDRRSMLNAAVPTTLASVAGLMAWLYLADHRTWSEATATLFVLLSLLTVPHAVLVAWARSRAPVRRFG